MTTAEKDHERKATAWACQTLALLNCEILPIPVPGGGWDVETELGWRSASNWRELCKIAREVQRRHRHSSDPEQPAPRQA